MKQKPVNIEYMKTLDQRESMVCDFNKKEVKNG